MAAPIYKGGFPFFKAHLRFKNSVSALLVPTTPGAPTNGTSGSGAGKAGPSSLYADALGGLYINTGTKASPVWTPIAGATSNNGAASVVSGMAVSEANLGGVYHQTTFTFTAVPLTLLDATVGLGTQIYTFPQGGITIQAANGSVGETTTSVLASTLNTGVTYNWGVGTVTQANGTLATTEQDLLPTTNGTASATINVAGANSIGVRTSAPASFNGNATAKKAFFNVGIATATDIDGDATTLWTGSIILTWMFNGLVS